MDSPVCTGASEVDLQRSKAAYRCQQYVSLLFPACSMSGSNGGDEEKRPRQVRRRRPVRALQAKGPPVSTSNDDIERLFGVRDETSTLQDSRTRRLSKSREW